MSIDPKASYTAADSIPLKVLLDEKLREATGRGRIVPVHAQLIPTNRCNLSCSFCSCSERDKGLEMPPGLVAEVVEKLAAAGTRAVTITGGGEPLLYPHLDALTASLELAGIKMGLVTNGLLLHKIEPRVLDRFTWCRISNGDDRIMGEGYQRMLAQVVANCPGVDWAFSHVVSENPNEAEIIRLVEFANQHRFTHVRLVADLFHPGDIPMDKLRDSLRAVRVDDSRVIYQGRKSPTAGGPCFIGFLKPLIDPRGFIFACCGSQYALATPSRDLPKELCLGHITELDAILDRSSVPLDGSICQRCYYQSYNTVLATMLKGVAHPEFL